MTPDQVIDTAIGIIERDGWNQGSYAAYPDRVEGATDDDADYAQWQAARNAPVCAMGAIYRALTGSAYGYEVRDADADADRAYDEMKRVRDMVVEQISGVPYGTSNIVSRNDDPATTKEDILLMLKRARHGG